MNRDERPIEGFVDADLGDVSADPQPTTSWGDAEQEIVAKLAEGDSAGFLARAKADVGFPFEPASDRGAQSTRQAARARTSSGFAPS